MCFPPCSGVAQAMLAYLPLSLAKHLKAKAIEEKHDVFPLEARAEVHEWSVQTQ